MSGPAYWFSLSSKTKGPIVASENVHILSDESFADTIGGDEPVLVDFWAEWCGPCKMIAPILDEIADEQVGNVKIAKLNVDDAPDTARQYEVMIKQLGTHLKLEALTQRTCQF